MRRGDDNTIHSETIGRHNRECGGQRYSVDDGGALVHKLNEPYSRSNHTELLV
jgi:hypothetical protein